MVEYNLKTKISKSFYFILCLIVVNCPNNAFSQTRTNLITETAVSPGISQGSQAQELWPNRAGKTLTTPSGWGADAYTVYAGFGASMPQPYQDHVSQRNDGSMGFGVGLGDSMEYVGVQLGMSVNDIDKLDNFSYSVKIHRYLGHGISIAGGANTLFPDKGPDGSDADESYYGVVSYSFQDLPSDYSPQRSKLTVSIGGGNGQFGEKSPLDIQHGKGDHGTYVFGAVAYELLEFANLIVEWNGINLGAGIALAPFGNMPIGVTIGIVDLIRSESGNEPRTLISTGFSYKF